MTAETVKSANVDSVASLRDLVTARSLELARLSSSNDRPVSTLNAQQNPIAGFGLPEGADNATTRLAGQSEASFRQSLAATDRPIAADASRTSQFAFSQNTAAREMVSRQLSEALGQRLAANIAAGHYRLTFNVNPKELGAIDVVMEMRDGRLDAQINTGNAVTRELLGDSLRGFAMPSRKAASIWRNCRWDLSLNNRVTPRDDRQTVSALLSKLRKRWAWLTRD